MSRLNSKVSMRELGVGDKLYFWKGLPSRHYLVTKIESITPETNKYTFLNSDTQREITIIYSLDDTWGTMFKYEKGTLSPHDKQEKIIAKIKYLDDRYKGRFSNENV